MRFLADENVERPIVDSLRAAGHDVACVADVAPGARDDEVLRLADSESRILLTNDKDFSELVYREGRISAGILLLRFAAEAGSEKASRLTPIIATLEQRLAGHFAVVSEERVRLRPLRRR